MAETINDNVNVTGGFSAGNWLFGTAKVPISSTTGPSMQSVQGLNPMGTGEGYPSMGLIGLVTSRSAYPGHRVKGVSLAGPSGETGTLQPTSLDIYIYRNTEVTTDVHWMVWREP